MEAFLKWLKIFDACNKLFKEFLCTFMWMQLLSSQSKGTCSFTGVYVSHMATHTIPAKR